MSAPKLDLSSYVPRDHAHELTKWSCEDCCRDYPASFYIDVCRICGEPMGTPRRKWKRGELPEDWEPAVHEVGADQEVLHGYRIKSYAEGGRTVFSGDYKTLREAEDAWVNLIRGTYAFYENVPSLVWIPEDVAKAASVMDLRAGKYFSVSIKGQRTVFECEHRSTHSLRQADPTRHEPKEERYLIP